MARMGTMVRLGLRERMALQDMQDLKGLKGLRVKLDQLDRRAKTEHPGKMVKRGLRVLKVKTD